MRLTATILTRNDAENIRAACEAVSWADEILVVDAESTDATRDIAQACGARVLSRLWSGVATQKQFAAEAAAHDWIFNLDADEKVSEELKTSIEDLLFAREPKLADAYRVARRAFFMGRWIKGGGWYPDFQLRLYNRTRGRWSELDVHGSLTMDEGATVETLKGDLLYYPDAAHHHRIIGQRYAPLAAQQMFDNGARTTPFRIASAGPAGFISSLILKGGFRDGVAGLSIAYFAAQQAFLTHLMLWEKQTRQKPDR